jgi:catechol 2,3-dioxygenase-like lactoylglutathione lyase family enzyme
MRTLQGGSGGLRGNQAAHEAHSAIAHFGGRMKVQMLHHVGMMVDDLDAAQSFYCDTLGLPLRERPSNAGSGLWVDLGNQRIDLGLPRNAPWEHYHAAFVVEDIEETVVKLQDAGVKVIEEIAPMMCVLFQDPFGNWIEMRKPPEAWIAMENARKSDDD